MMNAIIVLNFMISVLFTICYAYQFFYVFVGLKSRGKKYTHEKEHRYAVVVSARNESGVIGNLIGSIKNQNYPEELIDVYVIADNCTDNTAEVAKNAGAYVFERFNKVQVGKGYALDWFFKRLEDENKDKLYDAYIVFDADNIVDTEFVREMNKVFDNGYRIITSYRNSKNYGENWITAGYSLWFLREARYLNNARMQLGTSCAISGTGFLVSSEIIRENGGWIHHLLTEDIEFTTDSIIHGEKIGYCADAVLYDEQPTTFKQSCRQRMRWAKGFYQVFGKYGKKLFCGMLKGNFSCYDMLMTLMPSMLLTLISISVNLIAIPFGMANHSSELPMLLKTIFETIMGFYAMFFVMGAITVTTEWKKIYCSNVRKVLFLFTFPVFMLTYIPISLVALFCKVEWKPITHNVSKTLQEICCESTVVGNK